MFNSCVLVMENLWFSLSFPTAFYAFRNGCGYVNGLSSFFTHCFRMFLNRVSLSLSSLIWAFPHYTQDKLKIRLINKLNLGVL